MNTCILNMHTKTYKYMQHIRPEPKQLVKQGEVPHLRIWFSVAAALKVCQVHTTLTGWSILKSAFWALKAHSKTRCCVDTACKTDVRQTCALESRKANHRRKKFARVELVQENQFGKMHMQRSRQRGGSITENDPCEK